MQWGLDQSQSVTVPLTVTFLSVSYAAAPWCATIRDEKIETASPRERMIRSLPFTIHLHFPVGMRPTPASSARALLGALVASGVAYQSIVFRDLRRRANHLANIETGWL